MPEPTPEELAEIEHYRRLYVTPNMPAGEFAELLPEHLRRPYWALKLDEILGPPDSPRSHRESNSTDT